jgi:hypothetical protein
MSEIRNDSRSDSGSKSGIKMPDTRTSGQDNYAKVKRANKAIRLLDVLRTYKLSIEKPYPDAKWSQNIICPLSSHKKANERTPSFGYCFISDHFHCFGCKQSGRAVEFISLIEGVTRNSVADKILSNNKLDLSEIEDSHDNLSPLIIEYSDFFRHYMKNCNDKDLQKVYKVLWWLDKYLENSRNVEGLEARLSKAKDLLNGIINTR